MGDAETRRCERCGQTKPPAAFDRREIGAWTDGGLRGWCNACYRDPYLAIGERLPERPELAPPARPKPWEGRRAMERVKS